MLSEMTAPTVFENWNFCEARGMILEMDGDTWDATTYVHESVYQSSCLYCFRPTHLVFLGDLPRTTTNEATAKWDL